MVFGEKKNSATLYRAEPGGRMMQVSLFALCFLPDSDRSLSKMAKIVVRRLGDFFELGLGSVFGKKAGDSASFSEYISWNVSGRSIK